MGGIIVNTSTQAASMIHRFLGTTNIDNINANIPTAKAKILLMKIIVIAASPPPNPISGRYRYMNWKITPTIAIIRKSNASFPLPVVTMVFLAISYITPIDLFKSIPKKIESLH